MDIQSQEECPKNMEMLLPVKMEFEKREELLEHVSNFAKSQGYIVSIKKSEKDKKVIIRCDRGGIYRKTRKIPDNFRQKDSCPRLINCPLRIDGRRISNGSWILNIKILEHNHEALEDILGHPSGRRLSKEEVLRIKEMTIAGIQPCQILSSFKQSNPQLLSISRDVYNCIAMVRKEILAGRTAIQALVDELANGGFYYNLKNDEEGRLTHLFFAHPRSIILSKRYSNVFMMDYTYKTNKYKMPLFDVVGMTSFSSSFYSCFAFLPKEKTEDYVWTLEMLDDMLGGVGQQIVFVTDRELALMKAIEIVFPTAINLLCVWHIDKNILSKCKRHFQDGDNWEEFLSSWNTLINSPAENAYLEAWKDF
ncbi:protein FAR1-RELATED SEQUENCE 5-like [Tasmannia lanceolata]|uniref:protein FAR1-RELATED SEQUENCE 5-like n=1 Tax=Tasmannia lanceolata TaxID=3420 RepID=UPI0040646DD1